MMNYFRDAINKLEAYTPGYQPGDDQVIKLNTNENAFPPSQKVFETLRNYDASMLRRYPEPMGNQFRQLAAEINGVGIDNIICTNGGDELLTIAFRAFCDETRGVCWPTPTYSLYDELAGLQNCPITKIPYSTEGTLEQMAEIAAPLSILCNPNAPTGNFLDVSYVKELADILSGKGVLLIDEAYVDFAPASCVSLVKSCDNIIILRSMSKGYSLAGIRFGYGIVSANLLEGLVKAKDSYNVDRLSIELASAAISDRDYFHETTEKIKLQREKLTEELRTLGFAVENSHTNFLLAKHDKANTIYTSLRNLNIIVRYFDLDGLRDKLRITVGTIDENRRLLEALKFILGSLK